MPQMRGTAQKSRGGKAGRDGWVEGPKMRVCVWAVGGGDVMVVACLLQGIWKKRLARNGVGTVGPK